MEPSFRVASQTLTSTSSALPRVDVEWQILFFFFAQGGSHNERPVSLFACLIPENIKHFSIDDTLLLKKELTDWRKQITTLRDLRGLLYEPF